MNIDAIKRIAKLRKNNKELERLAETDHLTEIGNRRAFENSLESEISRSERLGENFCVLMIDIDYFKEVNDKYGHEKGDEVLSAVAKCLKENLRPYDVVCRYGGEEFVSIVPNTESNQGREVGDRLRKAVIELEDALKIPVTISVGVAGYDNLDGVVERADEAMYAAKNSGKNRVRAYDQLMLYEPFNLV